MENTSAGIIAMKDRTHVAHDYHANCVERLKILNQQICSAFTELDKAQAQLREVGVEAQVSFDRPMDSAWAAWRNQQR